MKLLFDTNILLDVLLPREPWAENGRKLWQANDDGQIIGFITATTLTDIFYITRRLTDATVALEAVKICLLAFEIAAITRQELEDATQLQGNDFEDNLQITSALSSALDAIITRDPKGFQTTVITIYTPEQALSQIDN
jgi:predicted nucleic acid-binding protein